MEKSQIISELLSAGVFDYVSTPDCLVRTGVKFRCGIKRQGGGYYRHSHPGDEMFYVQLCDTECHPSRNTNEITRKFRINGYGVEKRFETLKERLHEFVPMMVASAEAYHVIVKGTANV